MEYDWWLAPQDVQGNLLLSTTTRFRQRSDGPGVFEWGKSLLIPDRVAVTWTHYPANCFGRLCKLLRPSLLEMAHIRPKKPRDQTSFTDRLFAEEVTFVKRDLCRMMKEVGFGCEPRNWIPPDPIESTKEATLNGYIP